LPSAIVPKRAQTTSSMLSTRKRKKAHHPEVTIHLSLGEEPKRAVYGRKVRLYTDRKAKKERREGGHGLWLGRWERGLLNPKAF